MFKDFPPQSPNTREARAKLNKKQTLGITILSSGAIAIYNHFDFELLEIRETVPSHEELEILLSKPITTPEKRFFGEPNDQKKSEVRTVPYTTKTLTIDLDEI